jgi:hypothetical protein
MTEDVRFCPYSVRGPATICDHGHPTLPGGVPGNLYCAAWNDRCLLLSGKALWLRRMEEMP